MFTELMPDDDVLLDVDEASEIIINDGDCTKLVDRDTGEELWRRDWRDAA